MARVGFTFQHQKQRVLESLKYFKKFEVPQEVQSRSRSSKYFKGMFGKVLVLELLVRIYSIVFSTLHSTLPIVGLEEVARFPYSTPRKV